MTYSLSAHLRTGRCQEVRAADQIPAVIYGKGIPSRSLSLSRGEFVKVLKQAGSSSLIDVVIQGELSVKVLVKEVQRHVLRMEPIHVDLYQVRMDATITARVPLVFVGESAAIKLLGGTLMKTIDELEVECLPANLPHEISIDLGMLATFEDAVTVGGLSLPVGVRVTNEPTLTIASVSRPLTEEELKKMEEPATIDVSAVKTEGEEKRAAEEAKKAEEEAAKT